jgi:hypothetical protein
MSRHLNICSHGSGFGFGAPDPPGVIGISANLRIEFLPISTHRQTLSGRGPALVDIA